jgi:anti-sigma B factor antagonist
MDLQSEIRSSICVIRFKGRLDATTSNGVYEKLAQLIDQGQRRFIFNYTDLEYVSSAGLRTLLLVTKKLNGVQGKAVICCFKPFIKEIFDISGFSSLFEFYPTEEAAEQRLGSHA